MARLRFLWQAEEGVSALEQYPEAGSAGSVLRVAAGVQFCLLPTLEGQHLTRHLSQSAPASRLQFRWLHRIRQMRPTFHICTTWPCQTMLIKDAHGKQSVFTCNSPHSMPQARAAPVHSSRSQTALVLQKLRRLTENNHLHNCLPASKQTTPALHLRHDTTPLPLGIYTTDHVQLLCHTAAYIFECNNKVGCMHRLLTEHSAPLAAAKRVCNAAVSLHSPATSNSEKTSSPCLARQPCMHAVAWHDKCRPSAADTTAPSRAQGPAAALAEASFAMLC